MKKRLAMNPILFTATMFCLSWALLVIMRSSDNDISFSILTNRYGRENLVSAKPGEYMTGEIITGEFMAREDNLGIVSLRLDTDHVIDADKVILRLKEKGKNDWYYENRYRITKLANTSRFPFGFPVIHNSRGKIFRFEVEIIRGAPGNALQLNTDYPVYTAHYKFYKNELMKSPIKFAAFLAKKVAYYFSNPRTLTSTFGVLLIPLLLWAVVRTFYRKLRVAHIAVFLVLYLTVYEALYIVKLSETIILLITGAVLIPFSYLKLKSGTSFIFAFAYLVFMSLLFFAGDEHAIQAVAIWAYAFLILGLFQSYWELRPKR